MGETPREFFERCKAEVQAEITKEAPRVVEEMKQIATSAATEAVTFAKTEGASIARDLFDLIKAELGFRANPPAVIALPADSKQS